MATKRIKVWAIQADNGRWHFATPSIFRPGYPNKSVRTWSTKASALRAGRREYANVLMEG